MWSFTCQKIQITTMISILWPKEHRSSLSMLRTQPSCKNLFHVCAMFWHACSCFLLFSKVCDPERICDRLDDHLPEDLLTDALEKIQRQPLIKHFTKKAKQVKDHLFKVLKRVGKAFQEIFWQPHKSHLQEATLNHHKLTQRQHNQGWDLKNMHRTGQQDKTDFKRTTLTDAIRRS